MELRKNGKLNYHSIKYPAYTLKIKVGGKWVNTLHTKKVARIIFRSRRYFAKFKVESMFLRFQYNKESLDEGYYTNLKDFENAFFSFKELLIEFTS